MGRVGKTNCVKWIPGDRLQKYEQGPPPLYQLLVRDPLVCESGPQPPRENIALMGVGKSQKSAKPYRQTIKSLRCESFLSSRCQWAREKLQKALHHRKIHAQGILGVGFPRIWETRTEKSEGNTWRMANRWSISSWKATLTLPTFLFH